MLRKQLVFALVLMIAAMNFAACSSTNEPNNYAKDGLDLTALTGLVRKSKSAEDLETRLNQPDNPVNNLDLDENNEVDYVNVTEYGSGNEKGFSLTVDLNGETQEVANIQLQNAGDNLVNYAVTGNEQIYGTNARYEDSFGLDDYLFYTWLFNSSRPMYQSPYHGYYPPTYTRYHVIDRTTYINRSSPYRSTTVRQSSVPSITKTSISSPNAGKSATSIKAPLSMPSSSQRSYQSSNPSTRYSSSGFGKSASSSSSSSRPSSSSSSSSSGGRISSGGFGKSSSSSSSSSSRPSGKR